METEIASFLTALGVPDPADAPLMEDPVLWLAIRNTLAKIQNDTGAQPPFPAGLKNIAVSMAAGFFLAAKKAAGQLNLAGVDLDAAVKQIQEGDTSVTFAAGEGSQTPEQRLDSLIDRLTAGREKELVRYRRLIW